MTEHVAALDLSSDPSGQVDLPTECADLIEALQAGGERGIAAEALCDERPTSEGVRGGNDREGLSPVGLNPEGYGTATMLAPLLPAAWAQKAVQVIPDGMAKSGRPKPLKHRPLSVQDLDASLLYIQRRTRHVQSLTRATKPNNEQTADLVKITIHDSIRRLAMLLPGNERTAVEDSLAGARVPDSAR